MNTESILALTVVILSVAALVCFVLSRKALLAAIWGAIVALQITNFLLLLSRH